MIFGCERREENNNITRNASRSDILTLLTLLSADTKSAVLLRVPSLTKVEVRNFPLLHFPRWLCLVHGQLAMSVINDNVSVSSIFNNGQFYLTYYFLHQRNSPLKEIQLSVNCYVPILSFHSPKY